MKTLDILAFGEPLMEFAEVDRLTTNGGSEHLYLPGKGGDTSNAVIAAARQGAKVGYFTALGDDAFGQGFLDLWDAEGIDRSSVIIRRDGRIGIYFISYGHNGHVFSYYRAGSAASQVTPDEVPLDLVAASEIFHLSGISQAISTSCADAGFEAISHARQHGTIVSYDTNLRLRLWPIERARAVTNAAMALSDIALPGLEDAQQLTQQNTPDEICDFYLGLGCKIVALTLGKDGTMVAVENERRLVPSKPVQAVDATGAGDMFDGAFLAEWLRHRDPFRAAAYANAAAALSTLGHGAVAPMPRRAQVEAFLAE